ncbi:MAG: M1 family metallopeptidase [Pegethrix bostrychoides GSE-TBD4-15B]|uniref:M1 family metallopeptidase n=1 Tax=Pegethrix bostrychoides GSE-TBD4-15B TaxID=2839662 RepID=A0A951PDJ3_9CYAN|nr:M1 family metallopeptidase [Pegethrix bostrychoides GSE-TBD4-15B]
MVSATEEITYFNNSPDALTSIPFRLYLNAHMPEAMREVPVDQKFLTSGIQIDEFRVNGKVQKWDDPKNPFPANNFPGSTIHEIALDPPLPPHAAIIFSIRWHYDITVQAGWKEGAIDDTTYFLGYFYPRVSVYNDTNGWDYVPFTMGREFNNDYADYNFEVKVPKNFVVWATGDLLNPQEVLQPTYAQRLQASFASEQVMNIAQPEALKQGLVTAQTDTVTWKWQAHDVPDIAIALSNHYIWDAGSVVVDPATQRRASVQSAYAESAKDFQPMVEFGKHALARASTQYPGLPYPYSKTSIILGGAAGADEEYPMMVNDASNLDNENAKPYPNYAYTRFVATHELLHSWFPFYMGTNEKRYPFMDEGWTTAFEHLLMKEDLGEEPEIARFQRMRVLVWSLPFPGADLPIITPHDVLYGRSAPFASNQYGKAALGYLALRELMGDAAFKHALHEFMARWHGKHPLPWDMFNTFNNASGENYNWFFNNWFFSYNYLDLAIKSVQPTDSGYALQVENLGGMAMPFDVKLVYADGSKASFRQTPGIWQDAPQTATVRINSAKPLKSVALEGGIFVDFNPSDNIWERP